MERITIGSTGISCAPLAFGCAGAFHLPRAADRARLLDAAVDAGFTHFDVAPMYGMGRAEVELAPLLRRHGDRVTVTTKFGIRPSPVGLVAGRVQAPIRRFLAARPQVNQGLQQSAAAPTAGVAGRVLYRGGDYGPEQARSSLDRSLAALERGTIDLLILHDPTAEQLRAAAAAGTFSALEAEVGAGRIRSWGIAVHEIDDLGADLVDQLPFLQFRDDVLHPALRAVPPRAGTATYGVLAAALPLLAAHLASTAEVRARWTDALDLTDAGPRSLPGLLLREAARRNPAGPTLFTTTKPPRLLEAAEAIAYAAPDGESERLRALVAEAVEAGGAR